MSEINDSSVVPVSVTVTKDSNGDVTITCTPNPVNVGIYNTLIGFSLDTPGYRFRAVKTIELDEPNDDFPYPSWTVAPTLATLLDLCNQIDIFKYTIHVIDTRTGIEYSVDPEIKNGDASTCAKP
jgi:hypothetical protein